MYMIISELPVDGNRSRIVEKLNLIVKLARLYEKPGTGDWSLPDQRC